MSGVDGRVLATAALWMIGAIISFTSMAMAGRALGARGFDSFEIMLWRSLVGLVIVVAVSAASGTLRQVRTQRIGLHFLRNTGHYAGQILWFTALTMIPLAQVFALEFTGPIWVIVLSPLLLGERITRIGAVAAAIAFVGILVLTRPWQGAVGAGTLAAAGAAVGFALSAIFTRRLTRHESITSILFWLSLMQAIFSLGFTGADLDIILPSLASLPALAVVSLAGLVAHFCLTKALSLAPAPMVMPIDFLRLPIAAAIGALVYNEALDPWFALGGLLILGGNWLNLTRGRGPARAPAGTTGS